MVRGQMESTIDASSSTPERHVFDLATQVSVSSVVDACVENATLDIRIFSMCNFWREASMFHLSFSVLSYGRNRSKSRLSIWGEQPSRVKIMGSEMITFKSASFMQHACVERVPSFDITSRSHGTDSWVNTSPHFTEK